MKRFVQKFSEQGLIWAVVVWAGAVGLMAYHLTDSAWRLAFVALSVGGLMTVGGILWIRNYIDTLTKVEKGNG